MRQASLRAEAHVVSTQLMSKGLITQDDIELKSQANIKDVEVLWEGAEQGIYSVTIRADVKPMQMCQQGNSLRKAVAVTGFGLVSAKQTSLGQLQNIEQDLARVFINTFNDLKRLNKQVVLTSDRHPKELLIDERIRNRLEGGLIVEVTAPDLETKKEIIRKNCKQKRIIFEKAMVS